MNLPLKTSEKASINQTQESLDNLLQESEYYNYVYCSEETLENKKFRADIVMAFAVIGLFITLVTGFAGPYPNKLVTYGFVALAISSIIFPLLVSKAFFMLSPVVEKSECEEIVKTCREHPIAQQYRELVVSQGRVIRSFDSLIMLELIELEQEQWAFNQLNSR